MKRCIKENITIVKIKKRIYKKASQVKKGFFLLYNKKLIKK